MQFQSNLSLIDPAHAHSQFNFRFNKLEVISSLIIIVGTIVAALRYFLQTGDDSSESDCLIVFADFFSSSLTLSFI